MLKNIIFRITVSGESCWPELVPGKTYFASRLRRAHVGDYVVFKNPHRQKHASDTPPPFPLADDRLLMGNTETDFYIKKVLHENGGMLHVGGTVSWSSNYSIKQSGITGTVVSFRRIFHLLLPNAKADSSVGACKLSQKNRL